MNTYKLFPLGIAKGDAFCNRLQERQKLIKNIEAGRQVMVMSPRRYGKSSLILFVLKESKLPYAEIDLFVAVNAKMVTEQILAGVKNILNQINNRSENILSIIKAYIAGLKSKWIIGSDGLNLEFIPEKNSDAMLNIVESLQMLEAVLQKKKMRVCFFIDEFQEIERLDESRGIEGAIRHVAQNTDYLSFVFSGSNRRILASMFHDRERPLYKLCDTLEINRIQQKHYIPFLNAMAMKTWKTSLDEKVFQMLFEKTECHPYYMNALCSMIWVEDKAPTSKDIEKTWHEYILQEKSKTARELSALSVVQKKLLIMVSKGVHTHLSGKHNLHKLEISGGAVSKALESLEKNDYLDKDSAGNYYVVDPLIKSSLVLFYPDPIKTE